MMQSTMNVNMAPPLLIGTRIISSREEAGLAFGWAWLISFHAA
jgi:hypothetical protein